MNISSGTIGAGHPRWRAFADGVDRRTAARAWTALVARAGETFGVLELSIVHRAGRVPVGGASAVIACAAAHRSEAFAACSWVMDEVKRIVPIWKTEAGPAKRRARRP